MKNLLLLFLFFNLPGLYATSENYKIINAPQLIDSTLDTLDLNVLILELTTDEYPNETSWEVVDEAGTIVFSGSGFEDNYEELTTYFLPMQLPTVGCYRFTLIDSGGDGLCCGYGDGSYKLLNESGELLQEGGAFGSSESFGFATKGRSIASNDAAIFNVEIINSSQNCEVIPSATIGNLGADEITSLVIESELDDGTVETYDWTGNLLPGERMIFNISQGANLVSNSINFKVLSVNGQSDMNEYRNNFRVESSSAGGVVPTDRDVLIFELKTDEYPSETSWELTDDNGAVLYSGSGFNYESSTDYLFLLSLPGNGCYKFTINDSASDGLFSEGFRLLDASGTVLKEGAVFGSQDEVGIVLTSIQANDDIGIIDAEVIGISDVCGLTASVTIGNLGANEVTSLVLETKPDNGMVETHNWTGNLLPGEVMTYDLTQGTNLSSDSISLKVLSANAQTDNDGYGNNLRIEGNTTSGAVSTDRNLLVLELETDNYPYEISWELTDDNGTVLHFGSGNDYLSATEYVFVLPLPGDGCYQFTINDSASDGLFFGGFKLLDASGMVLREGASFGSQDQVGIVSQAGTVLDDAMVSAINFDSDSLVCIPTGISPEVEIINIGSNTITSMELETVFESGTSTITNWNGTIQPNMQTTVYLDPVDFNELGKNLTVKVLSVNNQVDNASFRNEITGIVESSLSIVNDETEYQFELQLDEYAYEIYWQISNSAGDVMVSGGNEAVGPDGAGLQVSSQSDPGAYSINTLVIDTFSLPTGDCYELLVVDDYSDGILSDNDPYLSLSTSDSLIYTDLNFVFFGTLEYDFKSINTSSTQTLFSVGDLQVFPNPTAGHLNITFDLPEKAQMNISVFNLFGQQLYTVADQTFTSGENQLQFDLDALSEGMYFLRFSSEGKQTTRKIQVLKN